MGIGARLESLRKQSGMTQGELAKKLHTTQPSIGHWENERRNIPQDKLASIAQIFNVTTDYLLGLNSPNKASEKSNDLKELIRSQFLSYGGKEISDHDLTVVETFLQAYFEKKGADLP